MIQTTHVGSLPRSQAVTDILFKKEHGAEIDAAEFDATISQHIDDIVAKQIHSGVDIVSDGEASKISYATYVKDRYHGFGGDSDRQAPQDLQLFPAYLKKIATSGGTPQYARPKCIAPLAVKNHDELDSDIRRLKNAIQKYSHTQAFMNAASPGVISLFLPNEYYQSRTQYLEALAEVLREEYERIVASGILLQIDCPDLALSRHMMFTDLSDEEFVNIANLHVEVLNYALKNIDPQNVRVHICWGNYEGPHICDIDMNKVFEPLMKVRANYVLFETANPRHGHEWEVFAKRYKEIPENKILVPGVIDSTTNFVEHPQYIRQRLERFIQIVGCQRVIAGSDCGFGTFAGFGVVDEDIVYEKLKALHAGTRLC